jgi:alpha-L-arabinofuranosidase
VRYCNVEKKYGVKYWEIGNETFWYTPGKHKRIRVTAAEYADAFVKYAKAMKGVDPTIEVGAIGLVDPTSSVNNTLADGSTADPPEPAWWPTVLRVAAPHVDFVTVHCYPGSATQDYGAFIRRGAWGAEPLPSLRTFLDKTLPKRVPIVLTEWNIDSQNPLEGMALAQIQANLLCHFIDIGVDRACIWPLRLPRGNARGLLDFKTRQPQPMYKVFQLFSQNLAGTTRIASESEDSTVFNFATISEDGSIHVVLIHKSTSDRPQTVTLRGLPAKPVIISGTALVAPSLKSTEVRTSTLCGVKLDDGAGSIEIPAFSICMINIRPK